MTHKPTTTNKMPMNKEAQAYEVARILKKILFDGFTGKFIVNCNQGGVTRIEEHKSYEL